MKHRILFSIVLSVCCSISSVVYAQSPSPDDSLALLIRADKNDTSKMKHLLELSWMIGSQYPDSSILMSGQSLDISSEIYQLYHHNPPADLNQALKKYTGKAYVQLGVFYYMKGEYPVSLEYHFKGLEIREELKDSGGIASSYNNLGLVFRFQGDYVKALEYYFKALTINIETGNKERVSQCLNNIGLVYYDQADYPKALEYFFKSLSISADMDNEVMMSMNYNNIGIAYYGQKEYKKARLYFNKALKINKNLDIKSESANNLANIGATYYDEGNNEEALVYFLQSLQLNEELGNKYGIALNKTNIGDLYRKQKNYSKAELYLGDALALAREINAQEFIKENNYNLSNLYSETNRYQLAFVHYQQYDQAKEQLFNDAKSKEIGRLEMKHEIEMMERERMLKEEEEQRIAAARRRRKDTLQYSGIFVSLLFIGIIVMFMGVVKVSAPMAKGVTFFSILLLFEFILLLIDPFVDTLSNREPVLKLLINAFLAICIFPVNNILENGIKKRLVKSPGILHK